MAEERLASRYGKALYDLSVENNSVENIKADVKKILELVITNKDFELMLKSPLIKADKKKAIMERLFSGHLQPVTEKFLGIVIRKKREPFLKDIMQNFINLYNKEHGITKATVFSAIELDDTLKARIQKTLEEKTDSKVVLDSKIDQSLIGGFILRYEDKLIDRSISSQLRELQNHLVN